MSWRIKDCATETYTEDNQYNMKKNNIPIKLDTYCN